MAAKILVVDDEVHFAKILRLHLQRAGYETILAYDGAEGLEMVRREKPSLVICDLMLPVMDGYRLCTLIKGDERTKSIPVIILSARDLSGEHIEQPIMADLLMEKPFNSAVLLEKISGLLTAAG